MILRAEFCSRQVYRIAAGCLRARLDASSSSRAHRMCSNYVGRATARYTPRIVSKPRTVFIAGSPSLASLTRAVFIQSARPTRAPSVSPAIDVSLFSVLIHLRLVFETVPPPSSLLSFLHDSMTTWNYEIQWGHLQNVLSTAAPRIWLYTRSGMRQFFTGARQTLQSTSPDVLPLCSQMLQKMLHGIGVQSKVPL